MARSLSANAEAEATATATKPRTIVKIEFPSPVGTKWYSDQTLTIGATSVEDRVVKWGPISIELDFERSTAAAEEGDLELRDDDKVLLGHLQDVRWQRARLTVYQWWKLPGFGTADLVAILHGIVNSPVAWNEDHATVSLQVTGLATLHDKTVGLIATREIFSKLSEQEEGKLLPLVYGEVRQVHATAVKQGAITELVSFLPYEGSSFVVADAERFPQGSSITVSVEGEHMTGSFSGNSFTITDRTSHDFEGTVDGSSGSAWMLVDASLSSEDIASFIGHHVRILHHWRGYIGRMVVGISGTTKLVLDRPYSGSGELEEPPVGTEFVVHKGHARRNHSPGGSVQEVLDEYVWTVNTRKSKAVLSVEAFGSHANIPNISQFLPDHVHSKVEAGDCWRPLPNSLYAIDLDDTQFDATPGLEHLTTITMKILPTEIAAAIPATWVNQPYSSNELRVWIKGTKVDSALLDDPDEVIEDVLSTYLGLSGGEIDVSEGSELPALTFGFELPRQMRAVDFLSELAMQAQCVLIWQGGKAVLRVLRNSLESTVLTISSAQREHNSFELSSEPVENVTTEVRAIWVERGERRELVVADAAAQAMFGRHVREVDFWAYGKRRHVNYMASWWLGRWKLLCDHVRLVTWLDSLEAEHGDWITINVPGAYTNQPAMVERIDHQPGSGVAAEMDRIELSFLIPTFAGCASTCELTCESLGCESYCMIACTTAAMLGCTQSCTTTEQTGGPWVGCWSCEAGCQGPCELECTAALEVVCISACMVVGWMVFGCASACESTDCETACETTCETGCEYGWEA